MSNENKFIYDDGICLAHDIVPETEEQRVKREKKDLIESKLREAREITFARRLVSLRIAGVIMLVSFLPVFVNIGKMLRISSFWETRLSQYSSVFILPVIGTIAAGVIVMAAYWRPESPRE
jgi:hypothetical protein